jgi:thioredoxin 1
MRDSTNSVRLRQADHQPFQYDDLRQATTRNAERSVAGNSLAGRTAGIAMSLNIICLCAEWCGTCSDFRSAFTRMAQQDGTHRFLWLDIEEHEELLDDIEIQEFPTIVIANDQGQVCFSGPMIPRLETLQRLCIAAQAGSLRSSDARIWEDLVRRVQSLPRED